jgi:hypothetical protein
LIFSTQEGFRKFGVETCAVCVDDVWQIWVLKTTLLQLDLCLVPHLVVRFEVLIRKQISAAQARQGVFEEEEKERR